MLIFLVVLVDQRGGTTVDRTTATTMPNAPRSSCVCCFLSFWFFEWLPSLASHLSCSCFCAGFSGAWFSILVGEMPSHFSFLSLILWFVPSFNKNYGKSLAVPSKKKFLVFLIVLAYIFVYLLIVEIGFILITYEMLK